MKKILKRFKESRKGFTLVEILVVLVIMAILAAVSIPSMVGFIDQARGKAYLAEARTVYVASQAAVSEQAGISGLKLSGSITGDETPTVTSTLTSTKTVDNDAVKASLETMLTGSLSTDATWTATITDNVVSKVEYVAPQYTVTFENGSSTIEKN